jgi:hypothetical protein
MCLFDPFWNFGVVQYKSILSIGVPILAHLYGLQENNIGQSIWDKMRSYWEHIWEHIEKNPTKKSNTPPQKKKLVPLGAC